MKVLGTDIYMTRGDSESIVVKLNGYSLTSGDKIEMTVRSSVLGEVLIHKIITEFTNNSAIINLSPEDTSGIRFGKYVYDIQLTYGGKVRTVVKPSVFRILEEVTYG